MFELLAIVAIVVIFLQNRAEFSRLREAIGLHQREINALKRQAALAESRVERPAREATTVVTPPPTATPPDTDAVLPAETIEPPPTSTEPSAPEPSAPEAPFARPPAFAPPPGGAAPTPKQLEQQFGSRAFVWLGGIALALSGFFLVKYSIDTGLLTEGVRCALGVTFGVALLAASHFVRATPNFANGQRIGQALAGAGIADLYGSLFAATTLYHLVPDWLGFGAMAVTTAVALVLSLRHGAPIAALGLIGGYATPALVQGEPNAPLLFGYLYLVFAGLTGVIRDKNWWWLSIPASLVAFAWVLLWLAGGQASHDAAWLSTFLLAIGATAVIAERKAQPDESMPASPHFWRRYFAPTGAVILMGFVAYQANFGAFEWAMFALFSLGAIGLAWFDDRTYNFLPWQAMGVNLVMLFAWRSGDDVALAATLAGFGILFCASAQALITRSPNPLSWGALSGAAALLYYLLAFDRLNWALRQAFAGNVWLTDKMIWAAIAFALAGVMTAAAARSFVTSREEGLRQLLQAIYAVIATSLISVGFAILLEQEYLSFALALEVLSLSWIASRVDVLALRYLAQVLTVLFAFSLAGDLGARVHFVEEAPTSAVFWSLVSTAIFQYALPAALFAAASRVFARKGDDVFVMVLELGAAALIAMTIYRLLEAVFLGHARDQSLIVESIYTNILLVLSIVAARAAGTRRTIRWAAMGYAALGLVGVGGFSLLILNPLGAHQDIGAWPLLNGLLIVHALPALLLWVVGRELKGSEIEHSAEIGAVVAYVLGFVWLSLSVRQLFNGAYLDAAGISDAEVYTYSAVWLATGIALLVAAAVARNQMMRFASLIVMLLTIAKVFLYDASALTGLWRVVSFLGLGLCLMGLGWFYTRFIFTPDTPEDTKP